MSSRTCPETRADGRPCQAAPVKDSLYCIMHSPEHAEEMKEARRLGGIRRRREVTVQGAYDFPGLGSVADIRRLLEIASLDTLGLENSVARNRCLASLAQAASRLLEMGVLEDRVAALETFVNQKKAG